MKFKSFLVKVVFCDASYPSKWVSLKASTQICQFLDQQGYKKLNSLQFQKWINKAISKKDLNPIIIFSKDVLPSSLLKNSLFKKYLQAGGSAIFIGKFPFSVIDNKGIVREITQKEIRALFPFLLLRQTEREKRVRLTEKGRRIGLSKGWKSRQPVERSSIDVPLAFFNRNLVSAWIKFASRSSEIIRIWDFPVKKLSKAMLNDLYELAEKRFDLGIVKVRLSSTPFLRKIKGSFFQAIKVEVENWSKERRGEITCSFGDRIIREAKKLKPGKQYFFFLVPEKKSTVETTVTVSIGSRRFRRNLKIEPAKKWILLITPTIHTDIGFTDTQQRVLELRRQNLDQLIEAMEKHPDLKWNIEVSFVLEDFLAHASEKKREKILSFIKKGRIDVNAFYLNILTGLCSDEALIRSLYFSKWLEDKLKVRFKTAAITDVPTYVWTLPLILKKAGIEYFVQGYNIVRAPFAVKTVIDLRKPYWWKGFGGRKILTFASSYATGEKIGLREGIESMLEKIPLFLQRYEKNYPFKVIFVYGYLTENQPFDLKFLESIREWNKQWEYSKLKLCTFRETFEIFRKELSDREETYSFDGGTYWEDGVASTAKEIAIHRKNQRDILTVEKIFSLASIFGKLFYREQTS